MFHNPRHIFEYLARCGRSADSEQGRPSVPNNHGWDHWSDCAGLLSIRNKPPEYFKLPDYHKTSLNKLM
jgi:hypothetical protein